MFLGASLSALLGVLFTLCSYVERTAPLPQGTAAKIANVLMLLERELRYFEMLVFNHENSLLTSDSHGNQVQHNVLLGENPIRKSYSHVV